MPRLPLRHPLGRTAAETQEDTALGLPPENLGQLLGELDALAGRLDLVLDPLEAAVDPAGPVAPAPK
jgi:hypothetical protein